MTPLHSDPHLLVLRRTAAEVLAYTMQRLFPQLQCVGGGSTNTGFFYDFVLTQPLTQDALGWLETQLRTLIKENLEIRSLNIMRENAYALFMHHHQPLLAEKALKECRNIISLVQINDFYGLTAAPHAQTTIELEFIKLLNIEQITSTIDQETILVTRIEGTVFADMRSLKQFVKAAEKLKKWDHRQLGTELNLFSFSEKMGMVESFWHPKGVKLKNWLKDLYFKSDFVKRTEKIISPLIVKIPVSSPPSLFPPTSLENSRYYLSETRLNQHLEFLKAQLLQTHCVNNRLNEFYQTYRYHEVTQLCGLFCSYAYESDLTTIICLEEQVLEELIYFLQFIKQLVKIFDFEDHWYVLNSNLKKANTKQSIKPISRLEEALQQLQIDYTNQEISGLQDACIEMRLVDTLGREWTSSVISLRKQAHSDPQSKKTMVLFASVFCSLERWIGLLIEHYHGEFPVWLAPEQVRILTVGEQNVIYAKAVYASCLQKGLRVQLDDSAVKLGQKVHQAEIEKIPYVLIIGDQERIKQMVTVRPFAKKDKHLKLKLDEFLEKLRLESINFKLGVNENA